jgi:DNA helicase-2/ATP-dependent DNA helicase PcrA
MKAVEETAKHVSGLLSRGEVSLAMPDIARLRTLDPQMWHQMVGNPDASPLISIRDSVLQDVTLVVNIHEDIKTHLSEGSEEEVAAAIRKHAEFKQVFHRFKEKMDQARKWMDVTSTERWLHRLLEATEGDSEEREHLVELLAKQALVNRHRRKRIDELEEELSKLRSQARSALENRWASRHPVVPTMNKKQAEAVAHHEGRLVVTAGPGSGKTHVLVKRMASLVEKGCPPERILMLTFTVKATAEMSERVSNELGKMVSKRPHVINFNSFCKECIDDDPRGFGFEQTPVHVAPGLRGFLVEDLIDADIGEELRESLREGRFRSLVTTLDELLHNRAMDPVSTPSEFLKHVLQPMEDEQEAALSAGNEPTAELLFARKVMLGLQAIAPLRALIRGKGGLTFGDQITLVHQRLMASNDYLESLSSRYDHVLVDEFQDNNLAQGQIVQRLSEQMTSTCVVGDADQAIYHFRGANVRNLVDFLEAFDDASRIDLNTGYRHSQKLIDLSTALIERNQDRMERPDIQSGWVGDDTTDVFAMEYTDAPSEAIESIVWMKGKHLRGYEWDEMAILARSLSHLESIKASLEIEGIPFVSTSSETLFLDPSTRYAGLLLRACLDPVQQGHALHMLMMEGAFGVLREDATVLGAKSRGAQHLYSLLEERKGTFRHPQALAACHRFIEQHRLTGDDLSEWMFRVMKDAGLTEMMLREGPDHPLSALLSHLATEVETAGRLLRNNIRFARLLEQLMEGGRELDVKDVQRPRHVLLSTVHQAKGLEWRIVLMPSMDKKKPPIPDDGTKAKRLILTALLGEDAEQELAQERIRVLYVGATRAIDTIHISYHVIGSSDKPREPNSLLEEAASSVGLEHVGVQHPSLVGRGLSGHERTLHDLRTSLDSALRQLSPGNEADEIRATVRSAVTYQLEQLVHTGRALTPELRELISGIEALAGSLSFKPAESSHDEVDEGIEPMDHVSFARYSWSMLNTYSRCPLNFHFKHRLRIATPSSRAAIKGTLVHDVLEELSKIAHHPSLDEINQCFDALLLKHANSLPILPEREVEASREAVHAWASSPQAGNHVVDVEASVSFEFHGRPFIGKIDRIDVDEKNQLRLVDFKTGKPGKKPGAKGMEQLLLYAHGWHQVHGQRPDVLVLDHVMHGETREAVLTPVLLEKGLARLIPLIEGIDEGGKDADPGHHCTYCDYRSLCPESQ